MSKHSIRTGSDSRLSDSRSSSSASIRRARVRCDISLSCASASCAFLAASSAIRRFSPRWATRTSTRLPRCSPRKLASSSRSSNEDGTITSDGIATCPA